MQIFSRDTFRDNSGVPEAAARNPALYELLVLFDAVRGGSARERSLAIALLDERWTQP